MILAFSGISAALVHFDAPLCPLAGFAHIPCPGCGLTRATLALLRGDFGSALALHPLAPVIAPIASVIVLAHLVSYWREGRLFELPRRASRWGQAALLGLAALMIGVWIARFFGAFGGPVEV